MRFDFVCSVVKGASRSLDAKSNNCNRSILLTTNNSPGSWKQHERRTMSFLGDAETQLVGRDERGADSSRSDQRERERTIFE